jgi:hypothetical protein
MYFLLPLSALPATILGAAGLTAIQAGVCVLIGYALGGANRAVKATLAADGTHILLTGCCPRFEAAFQELDARAAAAEAERSGDEQEPQ